MADTTEQQFAETVRDRLIKQLISANEQLEEFAYVASHDLREPLRILVCFTDLLEKEYSDRLDEEGRNYMAINRRAAKKMEAMVADLLEYGRLGQVVERSAETDCNDVAEQAVEALGEAIKATKASIQYKNLPTVIGNPLRLLRLFQNLIGNALKYHKAGQKPVIMVSAKDKDTHWQFAIADNGIGIKDEYLETIFSPFKRLHGDQDYTGTGIGLTICKRIVEDLGGTLWAQSTVDKGSSFFFTIPKTSVHS